MKFKKILLIMALTMTLICCLSAVNAADDIANSTVGDAIASEVDVDSQLANQQKNEIVGESVADSDIPLSSEVNVDINPVLKDNGNSSTSDSTTPQTTMKTPKIKGEIMFLGGTYIKKTNKNFRIKATTYNEKKDIDEALKGIKLIVKIKNGKNVKTYNVKTNKNGIAKVLNIKNLKKGAYKVTVTSGDERYQIKEYGYFVIYGKPVKKTTLIKSKSKKLRGDKFIAKSAEDSPNEVYADNYNAKSMSQPTNNLITKAKFIFKNKNTGKTVSKISKGKDTSHGWMNPHAIIPKGYELFKTKVQYLTR